MAVALARSRPEVTPGGATAAGGSPVLWRVAFYGRKNRADAVGVRALGRQFLACQRAAEGKAVFTRYFYDLPVPVDEVLELAVHGASGPLRRHGGWTELATLLPAADRGFDAIVCSDVDRLSRSAATGCEREELAAAHGVAVLYADMRWLPSLTATAAAIGRRRWVLDSFWRTPIEWPEPVDGR